MYISQVFVEGILEELTDLEVTRQNRMFGQGAGEAAKKALEKKKKLWKIGKRFIKRR